MRLTIKLGGSILEESSVRHSILDQVSGLRTKGHEVVLVHGGGKSLSRRLDQFGIPSRFIAGLRVTDSQTLGVALMVLGGEINKGIVVELAKFGTRAVGICGADAGAVRCVSVSETSDGREGLGFVGRPVGVEKDFFELLLKNNFVPVISSLALGPDFQLYNINADEMAAACAWGIRSEALVFLTDVPGVRGAEGLVLKRLGRGEIEALRDQGVIAGGMLPKTRSCLEALERGVPAVYIVPGASPDVLRQFVNGGLMEGTLIHGNN